MCSYVYAVPMLGCHVMRSQNSHAAEIGVSVRTNNSLELGTSMSFVVLACYLAHVQSAARA